MVYKSIIIGAGAAGLTAAVYLARSGLEPLVIKGLKPSSHIVTTMDVEYFPGFPQGIKGPELLDNMYKQAEQFGATFRHGTVVGVDLTKRPFTVSLAGGQSIQTEALIIATGTSAKDLDIPGGPGRGVSLCAPSNGFSVQDKKVLVIGGGDSAMEETDYLSRYASEIVVVHRREELKASPALQERIRTNRKVRWALNRTPLEVKRSSHGVTGLTVRNNASGEEEFIPADGIFVAIGKSPNTEFLQGQLQMNKRGYLTVKPGTTETEIPGVFACGDVQDVRYGHLISAVGSGCMAAIDCERYFRESAQ